MLSPELLDQVRRLHFADPALEAEFHAERRNRDALRTQRVGLTFAAVVAILGVVAYFASQHLGAPLPLTWLALRFGVLIPALILIIVLAGQPWGRAHLQTVLSLGLAIALGAHAFEWAAEWTPAMSLRQLWLVPLLTLWATVMTLPLNASAGLTATAGALGAATLATIFLVRSISWPMLAAMALAYVLAGWALTLLCRWRERDWRMLFVIRREAEQLAEKLRAQNELLHGLNQQRDDFVAGVLHDLRSPVTGVLLTADLLRNESAMAPAARDALLDDMARGARRIDEFATQFLEQRALERAAEKLRPVSVPLAPVVERAVERARLTARHKAQHIILEVSSAAPALVAADELLLDRALGNLLDNAVKYSPRGGTITVHTVETAAEVRVAVRDSGPGLSAEDRAKLFQPYARLSQKPTGGEFSTGLGLSLVKNWLEAMGGSVGCDSEPGRGATFWLALPRHQIV